HSGAELLAFLDADDLAVPDRLAQQHGFLERNPGIAGVASRCLFIDAAGQVVGASEPAVSSDDIPALLLFENCIVQSSVMLRRARLDTHRFRTEFEPAEDYDLWGRMLLEGSFSILDSPLIHYRNHPAGISARRTTAMEAAVCSIVKAQLERLGLVPDSGQLELHRLLARWPLSPQMETLNRAEAWLRKIQKANQTSAVYSPAIFEKLIGARWFQICNDSWQLGLPAWKAFYKSPLWKLAGTTLYGHYLFLRNALPQSFGKQRK
ncbi:MAG: hypothetical protein WCH43_01405, partial [Verrucomicrobiota bacterium]